MYHFSKVYSIINPVHRGSDGPGRAQKNSSGDSSLPAILHKLHLFY